MPRDLAELVAELTRAPGYRGQPIVFQRELPGRAAVSAALPQDLPDLVRSRLRSRGIESLWSHQAAALAAARAGRHVIVATGTASGKSLCYQLPVLEALLAGRTALYLAPTKALAADQLRAVRSFLLTGVRAASYDGDTPPGERRLVRSNVNFALTNPDMLHRAILPNHEGWSAFFTRLAYVVVDEAHVLRGVFGSHVAAVLRRLRRIAAHYGALPTFMLASATVANPREHAARLTGLEVDTILDDGAPSGPVTFALWEPPLDDPQTGRRRSANQEAATWLAHAVGGGVRTLCFTRSRKGAELVASAAQRQARAGAGRRIRAYRAGYLPEDRRALERDLSEGRLDGVATTNALELGIDIGGLDAIVLDGFPGTVASMWQQAGRAGRGGGASLAVLVGADDPLDAYLLRHPDDLLGRPHEAALLDAANPYVLRPQLACAAHELPLDDTDTTLFGPATTEAVAELEVTGDLFRRGGRLYGRPGASPAAALDLRSAGGPVVTIVVASSGQVLGTADRGRALTTVHPGATYLHQGESWRVRSLDLGEGIALVEGTDGDEYTRPFTDTDLRILEELRWVDDGAIGHALGRLAVTHSVTGFERRRVGTGELLGGGELDLPPEHLVTVGYWYTLSRGALAEADLPPVAVPGAAHAAEHAQIALLPLIAMCDRWDIGGLSTAWHPDTEAATIFVYDGYAGGAGIAERGFEQARRHLTATRDVVAVCPCDSGCLSCVHSPKCGNGNHPLDKHGAKRLLDRLLASIDTLHP